MTFVAPSSKASDTKANPFLLENAARASLVNLSPDSMALLLAAEVAAWLAALAVLNKLLPTAAKAKSPTPEAIAYPTLPPIESPYSGSFSASVYAFPAPDIPTTAAPPRPPDATVVAIIGAVLANAPPICINALL